MTAVTITKDNIREFIHGSKPALLVFSAPWCSYCRRIAPALKVIAEQYEDTLATGQINIDDSPELAEEYQVEVVPTLIVFKDGQPAGDTVAPESKAQIEALIRQHV